MEWLTIGMLFSIVLVLTLAGLWLLRGFEAYTPVFSDEHCYEVSARLPALKRAALERVIVPEAAAVCMPEDPRGMLTSAGLTNGASISEAGVESCLGVSEEGSPGTLRE